MVLEAQTDHKGNLGADVANMADPDELPVAIWMVVRVGVGGSLSST